MARVRLEQVGKTYPGNIRAVEGFDLEVHDKEFLIIVGPSGCGKSTVLRMIAGLEEITHGRIHIGARLVNDIPPKDRDIAMVFQNYALYPHMSVYENMAFGLRLRKLSKAEIERRVRETAALLGIAAYLNRKPKALSGGQRQRVAVGRAIVRKPAVFLFDEPLSNLDAKMRVQMRAEISKLHARLEATMIYVTHDQVEAMTMADRIVVMRAGVIQQVAEPVELYDQPANLFVAGFIGTPPMNFFSGTIQVDQGRYMFQSEKLRLRLAAAAPADLSSRIGQAIIMGLRPEHIGSPLAERHSAAERLPAMVEGVEPMGPETYVYLRTGEQRCVAKMDAHRRCRVGEQLQLPVMMSQAHFFDPLTSQRLASAPAAS